MIDRRFVHQTARKNPPQIPFKNIDKLIKIIIFHNNIYNGMEKTKIFRNNLGGII